VRTSHIVCPGVGPDGVTSVHRVSPGVKVVVPKRLTRHNRSAVYRVLGAALSALVAVPLVALSPAAAAPSGRGGGLAVDPLTDTVRDDQWQLARLGAPAAWRTSTGAGVTVAVIDSGVDARHPDLVGQVKMGNDFVMPGGDGRLDPVGHGTTVAGLIAGRNDDGEGVVGLAPEAKILPVRVLDEENRYDDALIVAKAVRWAVDEGADVINLSLGGAGESPQLAAALDYAFAKDVVVVACTGNIAPENPLDVWYPAREPGVIAVAGLDRRGDALWPGSITGAATVLTAPATSLVGARPEGFWRVQGTSFAAPLVSATAALVRSRWPGMPAGDVVNRLLATARDLGTPGRDARFGYGSVDPVAALTAAVPAVGSNPLDDHRSPGEVGFGRAPGGPAATVSGGGGPGPVEAGTAGTGWAAGTDGQPREQPAGSLVGVLLIVLIAAIGLLAMLARRYRAPLLAAVDFATRRRPPS
jgi:type VII secretion-associated serine protease mycosin